MLVITGPGRSGTSMLAQFCNEMGFHPGGKWCDEVNAGLEDPRVVRINDALYREARTTGSVAAGLEKHRAEMAAIDLAVVKDPRFTYHPAILRAWFSVRPDMRVLVAYRDPNHSIASRKRHRSQLFVKRKSRPETLKCDMADTLEVILDCGIPYELLLFPKFLHQYERVQRAFEQLGLPLDRSRGRTVWDSIVDDSRVHFKQPVQPAARPTLAPSRRPRVFAAGRNALFSLPVFAFACFCRTSAPAAANLQPPQHVLNSRRRCTGAFWPHACPVQRFGAFGTRFPGVSVAPGWNHNSSPHGWYGFYGMRRGKSI